MSVRGDKEKLFSNISSLKVSTEGFPKMDDYTSSIPSINNGGDGVSLLLDLIKNLIGYESLEDILTEILVDEIDDIEIEMKKSIKRELKTYINCELNPTIPDTLINDGITLGLDKIDYLDIFLKSPTSDEGKLYYDDTSSGFNSSDFNTYLYEVIQDNGNYQKWGDVTLEENILEIAFNETSSNFDVPNNNINVKILSSYKESGNKLVNFNNDYVDSIDLFDSRKLTNQILDDIFGSVSSDSNINKEKLKIKGKIDAIIEKVMTQDDEVIDDGYFSFDTIDNDIIEEEYIRRQKGGFNINLSESEVSNITLDTISNFNSNMSNSTDYREDFKTSLNEVLDEATNDVPLSDKEGVKGNIIEKAIHSTLNNIVYYVLSPKVMVIFAMNHKIIHDEDIGDISEFIKKNRSLVYNVLSSVKDVITDKILNIAIKELTKIAKNHYLELIKEQANYERIQLLSLVGIDPDIIDRIRL